MDRENSAAGLPSVVLSQKSPSLPFCGGRQDGRYAVETCTDLHDWTTNGVTLSEGGVHGLQTACVETDAAGRHLRVVVTSANPMQPFRRPASGRKRRRPWRPLLHSERPARLRREAQPASNSGPSSQFSYFH